MIAELVKFREKYPGYDDLSDEDLAGRLAAKYPDAYGDLPDKLQGLGPKSKDGKFQGMGGEFGGTGASGEWEKPPSGIGHLANVAARGVYKGASALVGAPVDLVNLAVGAEKPVGGSDWIMENVFDPFQPGGVGRPQNTEERVLQATTEGVGSSLIPTAAWLRAARVAQTARFGTPTRALVDQLARLAVDSPAKFAALETASAATAGAGSEATRTVAENLGAGPVGQTVAAIGGGLIGGLAPLGAVNAGKKVWDIRSTQGNAAAKGRDLAGDVIFRGEGIIDPLDTQVASEALRRESGMNAALIGEGSPESIRLTTPEVTKDPRLMALYQSRRTNPDSSDIGSPSFLQQAQARQIGNERGLASFAPQSSGDIRDAMQNVKAQRDALANLAEQGQDTLTRAVEALVPGISKEESGKLIRAALAGQDRALGAIYRPLFEAVDAGGLPPAEGMPLLQSLREWSATEKPGNLVTLPTETTRYKKQYESRLRAEQEKQSGGQLSALDELYGWEKPASVAPETTQKLPLPFSELDDLQSSLGVVAARYRRNDPGNRPAIKAIEAQQDAVRKVMDTYGEGAGAEAKAALEKAKAVFREYASPSDVPGGKYGMRSEEVLDALATSRGGPVTAEAAVPALFWKPGNESGQGAQRLIDALGRQEAERLLEPEAMRSMLAAAWDPEKQAVNPRALARWKTQHEPALSRFPVIKAASEDVARLQKEAAGRAADLSSLESRGAAFRALTGETPEAVAPQVLSGDDPVTNMRQAMGLVADSPSAQEGLRAGVIDAIKGKTEAGKVPAPGEAARFLQSKLKAALDPSKKTRSALVELFGQDGIERWDDTLEMAGILGRSSEHPNIGSPTATLANFQTAAGRKMHGLSIILSRIFGRGATVATQTIEHVAGPVGGAVTGGLIGGSAGGPIGAVGGAIAGGATGSYMKLARMTTEEALKVLDEALLDPQKYAALWDDHLARTNKVAQQNLGRLVAEITGETALRESEEQPVAIGAPSQGRQIYYSATGEPSGGYLDLIGQPYYP